MTTIALANSINDFFSDIVDDALKSRRVDATDGAAHYLVSLLIDFAKPDTRAEEAMERPLAFLLDEALHAPDSGERFDRLRALGDGVLYTCGFFGDHLEARGVDHAYVVGIGSTAYDAASSMLRGGGKDEESAPSFDIYGELAHKFDTFVSVIADVADATIAQGMTSSRDVLKVYERWLKTGSERLAQSLTSHGVVPMRTTGSTKRVLQ